MTLSSSSTDAEVRAAYEDNASYAEDRSTTKCRAFITACRILILREPQRVNKGTSGYELAVDEIAREKRSAEEWLRANSTNTADQGGSRFNRVSFRRGGRGA